AHSLRRLVPLLLIFTLSSTCSCDHRDLHSFPTRRSSDLIISLTTDISKLRGSSICTYPNFSAVEPILSPLTDLKIAALISFLSRSEEHTSELQSRFDLVCRLLLEKKK